MADAFEKTNWGWEFSQQQQKVGEWLEYQLNRLNFNTPKSPGGWSIDQSLLEKVLNFLFWLLVAAFVAWVVWRLWREFGSDVYRWLTRNRNFTDTPAKNTADELSVSEYLGRSQELYRQGNYGEACRCLYLAMLHQLHEKAILPHKRSRTDGEYLQLLRLSVTPMRPYETLITTHEELCFGDRQISGENYQQCQQAYQEIADG